MADEFELYRKRSYHGGYDHHSPLNDQSTEDTSKSTTFKVPPLKRSRSHPMAGRTKTPLSPLYISEKNVQFQPRSAQPSFLCHKQNNLSPDLKRGVVKHVLHTTLHSSVFLPKSRNSSACDLCQRRVPQNNQHTRIIKTPSVKKDKKQNSSTQQQRKTSEDGTGDSMRNCSSPVPKMKERTVSLQPVPEPATFQVTLLGHQGVGKSTLIRTFATADDVNPSTENECFSSGVIVSIMGDGSDDSLILTPETIQQVEQRRTPSDAFIIVYAVNDKQSFGEAAQIVKTVRSLTRYSDVPIIIAANKGDIVRNRSVKTKDGHDLAARYGAKYVEVSALLNIHIDELFLGVLAQAHFARERQEKRSFSESDILVHRKPPISKRAMGYIGKLFSKYRDCERDIDYLFQP